MPAPLANIDDSLPAEADVEQAKAYFYFDEQGLARANIDEPFEDVASFLFNEVQDTLESAQGWIDDCRKIANDQAESIEYTGNIFVASIHRESIAITDAFAPDAEKIALPLPLFIDYLEQWCALIRLKG